MAEPRQGSSIVTAFRALFMLCCLVAIPLAAVLGKTFPGAIDRLMEGKWPIASAEELAAAESVAGEPTGVASADPVMDPHLVANNSIAPLPSAGEPGDAPGLLSDHVMPASYQEAIDPAFSASPENQSPVALAAAAAAAATPNAATRGSDGQLSQMLTRFRELGAVNYRMEFWGGGQDYYRFQCQMAVNGASGFRCHFEETGADPLQVMSTVYGRVQKWVNEQSGATNISVPNRPALINGVNSFSSPAPSMNGRPSTIPSVPPSSTTSAVPASVRSARNYTVVPVPNTRMNSTLHSQNQPLSAAVHDGRPRDPSREDAQGLADLINAYVGDDCASVAVHSKAAPAAVR